MLLAACCSLFNEKFLHDSIQINNILTIEQVAPKCLTDWTAIFVLPFEASSIQQQKMFKNKKTSFDETKSNGFFKKYNSFNWKISALRSMN